MALTTVRPEGMGFVTGRRNLIINGAMQVHQRGNQTASHGTSTYFLDRWNEYQNSTDVAANLQQSTVVPSGQGFSNSLLIDCTTADTSVASTELVIFRQIIEGQNLQQLAYNTSSAKSVTLSFWVRSTKTGTYVCELFHISSGSGVNRTQSHQYTISSADTWEYKTITFSGDTAAIMDNDSNASLYVQWCLQAGSDYSSGGSTNSTWATDTGSVTTKRYVGQVNFFDSTSNNFYLTGVQLEVGENASDFEHRSYGEELALCQRYYHQSSDQNWLYVVDADDVFLRNTYRYPVTMRTTPTITVSFAAGGGGTISSSGTQGAGPNSASLFANMAAANQRATTSGTHKYDAEL
jgi:hypothetical protein